MAKTITAKVDDTLFELITSYSRELHVSKSWIVQQALKQYFNKYDEYISDIRIASLSTISHDTILNEYGQNK